jgi:hypothetical protein
MTTVIAGCVIATVDDERREFRGALCSVVRGPVDTLLVGGRVIVRDGELRSADLARLAGELARGARRLEASG